MHCWIVNQSNRVDNFHFISDVNEIYSRIFQQRQFLTGEINYFLKEFEVRLQWYSKWSCWSCDWIYYDKDCILNIFSSVCWLFGYLQQQRNDREVENLFASVQNTIEAKDSTIEKCLVLCETNLPLLKIKLDETSTLCENVLNRGVNQEAVCTIWTVKKHWLGNSS